MSLDLRKNCQDTLNTAMLGEYHARISDDNTLSIVGSCGKPFITVAGIKFSRSVPAKSEITYAAELLQEFLVVHKEAIADVIAAKATLFNATIPEEVEGYSFHLDSETVSLRKGENLYFKVHINTEETSLYMQGCSNYEIVTAGEVKTLMSASNIKRMKAYYNSQRVYQDIKNALSDATAALETCDI